MNEFALNGTVLKNREKFDSVNSNNSHIDTFSAEFFARNEEFNGLFVKLFHSLVWIKPVWEGF